MERVQSHWNLPGGSQAGTAGLGVMQTCCYSYRMGMMAGLSLFFFFSFLYVVSLPHLVPPSVYPLLSSHRCLHLICQRVTAVSALCLCS